MLLSHSSELHGAELSLVEAASSLAARSVEVHVALPRAGPLADALASRGVAVTVARHPWLWWATRAKLDPISRFRSGLGVARRSVRPVGELRAILKALHADVVVTNTSTFPQGAIAAKVEGVPHVWHVREFGREDLGLRSFIGDGVALRLVGAMSARVIACSNAVAAKLAGYIDPAKIRVVYNAVDAQELPVPARGPEGPLRLLVLGRLEPGKGQEDAVRATGILARRGLDVELSLVGGGREDYRSVLTRLAVDSAVEERVVFHDFAARPRSHFASCDVFLMTSRSEAFGRVTVEAMKAGRPIVAAGAAGTLELVRDGWNGLLYRVGDAQGLARQVERLYEHPALRSEIAIRGQEWARQTFTLERHGSDLLKALSEVAGRGASPPGSEIED